jgi:hypothetical protein
MMPAFVVDKLSTLMEAQQLLTFRMEDAMERLLNWSRLHFINASKGTKAAWEALELRSLLNSVLSSALPV